jgi:hypothetical protein
MEESAQSVRHCESMASFTMKKTLFLLLLVLTVVCAQNPTTLTNEMIIKMVSSGVPEDVIIRTIDNADSVAFGFLPYDLQMFQVNKVPDSVVKAMAARDKRIDTSAPVSAEVKPAGSPASAAIAPVPTPRTAETRLNPKVKSVKIHGYVTSIQSPTEFEIDEYRITKDSRLTLELEKSDDPDEKTAFDPQDLRVGTEMEVRGDLDEATNRLTARAIEVNLDEHSRLKREALMESTPQLTKVGTIWEGQLRVDGQRVIVNESTAVTVKPNGQQKKVLKEGKKSAKQQEEANGEDDAESGVALTRVDQIKGNTWVSYEGTRQKDGTILAKKVQFTDNELTSGEARLWKSLSPQVKPSNYTSGKPGELKIQQVGKFKLIPSEQAQKYIQDLGNSLVPKFQRDLPGDDPQKIPFQFFLVENKEPNAFALANGTVIVHSGIMTLLENEAQLAAVVGHEISHATEEHTYRQAQHKKNVRTAIAIAGAIGAAYGGRAVADLTNMTLAAMRNGYSRSLENQADRVGLEYMVSAGYDPREAPRVWKVMALKLGDKPTNFFWSNHDNDATRRSYLMPELKNNYADTNFESYRRDDDRFHSAVAALGTQHGRHSHILF